MGRYLNIAFTQIWVVVFIFYLAYEYQGGEYNINSCHSACLGKPNMYIQLYWQSQTGDKMENTSSGEIR